jgi:hypothetical protein
VRHKAGPEYQWAAPRCGDVLDGSDMICLKVRGTLAEKPDRRKHKSPGFRLRCETSRREFRDAESGRMTQQSTEIEVEVVEIDGVTPVATRDRAVDHPPPRGDWQDWRQWRGQVSRLDSRWWPLWVILGIIALSLFLTVGLVLGVVFVIIRLCLNFIRAILR